jgi:endoglucanase
MISRRRLLVSAAALTATRAGLPTIASARAPLEASSRDPLAPLWQAWKRIHVSSSGRVIDRLQNNISHSEGQGYALLIAEALGDRESFDRILDWTLTNLGVRDDSLLAWSWHPKDGGGVVDDNNASDGDLFAGWALARAGERFAEPRYKDLAGAIAADLVAQCLRPAPDPSDGLLLLPGAVGFDTEAGFVINPAYYMLRAMRELGQATGETDLVSAAADGNALLSRLARDSLVPDWVALSATGFAPVEGKSGDFGYEALRVPLYLVWSGLPGHPAVSAAREAYIRSLETDPEAAPTVIDRRTGEVRETSTDPGYLALAALTVCAEGNGTGGIMPAFSAGQSYYPGVLHLLSLLAQRETRLGCYPR